MTNANVYVNGNSMLGKAEEIDLPSITAKLSEHKALGMQGLVELPSGFEKMEVRIKWNSFYPDAASLMANPFQVVELQCRSSVDSYESGNRVGQQKFVCFMRGQFKQMPAGQFKQNDNVELDSRLTIHYIKIEINNTPKVEFDVMANIYKVDGVDLLSQYKANIGQ